MDRDSRHLDSWKLDGDDTIREWNLIDLGNVLANEVVEDWRHRRAVSAARTQKEGEGPQR